MTIAVDFDGTITQRNAYPDIGPFRKNAINVLKALQEKGNDICLWTCRHGETLAQALTNLKEQGFTPNYVNCAPFTTGSQKIIANIYIDDAAWPNCCFPEENRIDWNKIGESLGLSEEEINATETKMDNKSYG